MFKFIESHIEKSKEKKAMHASMDLLISEGTLSSKFIVFTIISAMLAALGIIMNNYAILIGAMLIAPLLIPVISLSVGIGAGSIKLINHSVISLTIGLVLSILSAMFITWLVGPEVINGELYATFSDSYLYSIVAFLSGIVAVYSWFKTDTNQIIPGVAIAVALIPPVAFAGTVIIIKDQTVLIDILQLIFINLAGIFLGGLLTFIAFAVFSKRPTTEIGEQVDKETNKKK